MRIPLLYSIIIILVSISCSFDENSNYSAEKPRIIITTDIGGDPDDQQSMVRLLVHSNEFDIEALIATASGTPGELGVDTVKDALIREYIAGYKEVYPNLKKHSEKFPEPDYLSSIVKKGNPYRGTDHIGKDKNTEASDYIVEVVDREDERKVNICIWGGQTDLVQALWQVKNSRSHSEYNEFISKLRVYDIADQDGLYKYIRKEFPELFYVLSKAPKDIDKREAAFRGMYLGGNESLTSLDWINRNVREDHGPLGALYPAKTWTAPNPHGVMKEGDTPSWFFFLPRGLQSPEHPEWGGWGGRFHQDTLAFYRDAEDFAGSENHARATVYRWREFFQSEFEARMDWCVMSPDEANHAPVVVINDHYEEKPLITEVRNKKKISFDASESFDPDGNSLEYRWWVYPEPGSICPELENPLSPVVSFVVPDASGEIHLICEVKDNGEPSIYGFKRVVINLHPSN